MPDNCKIVELTVSQRLRAARQAHGFSIEEIGRRTCIPIHHLDAIEAGDWQRLRGLAYSVGFAKTYADAVGLDRGAIAEQLRAEMGASSQREQLIDVPQVAAPKQLPSIALFVGAIAAVALLLLLWFSSRLLDGRDATAPGEPMVEAGGSTEQFAPAANGPVVITANEPAWIRVMDRGKQLFSGELGAGQSYELPAGATAPVLETRRPELLRVSVGTADAPPVGPTGRTVSGVSLRATDLLRPGSATPPIDQAETGANPP